MKKKKKQITAAELMAELQSDPKYVAARRAEEEARSLRAAELRRSERPLIEDLGAVGIQVRSVWDLVNLSVDFDQALPVLLDHLNREYPEAITDGIARALAVPESIRWWRVLVDKYRVEERRRAKGGLAVAISACANESVLTEVIELVRDVRHGGSRVLLLDAIAKSPDSRARAALEELATDPDLSKEIRRLRRNLGY